MDVDLKSIWKNIIHNKAQFKLGLYSGIWLTMLTILVIFSWNVKVPAWTTQTYDVPSSGRVFGFPSYAQATLFTVDLANLSGDCINVRIHKDNGQTIEGFYCKKDEIIVGDYILQLSDIKSNSGLEKPITVKVTNILDFTPFFKIVIFFLPFYVIYQRITSKKEEKQQEENKKKLEKYSEKIGLSIEELKDMIELTEED